jgi:hypothetical protein
MQAAHSAGMRCVMVPDPRINLEDTKLAWQVLPSLLAFRPESAGLPPYDAEL